MAFGGPSTESRTLFHLQSSLCMVIPSPRTLSLRRPFDLPGMGRLSSQSRPQAELERPLGRWIVVLVFSGYVLHWRRRTSHTQPFGRQGACGKAKGVRLAVLGGAGVTACLARDAGARPRGQHRAEAARGGVCSGRRWRWDGSRRGGGLCRNGPNHGCAASW